MMRSNSVLIAAVFTLVVGGHGAFADDPQPQGAAAPSVPDTPAPADKGQPIVEQHDTSPVPPPPVAPPPVVPPPTPAQEAQPLAKPDDTSTKAAEDQKAESQKAEAQKAEASKNVEPVAPSQAFSILGKKVHGPDGKDVFGAIIDVLVDNQGQPRAAIIDFGGFLGVGSRKIAVDWQLLKFQPTDQAVPIVLDLDRKQIQAAPEYKDPTQPAEVVGPALVEIPPMPPVPTTDVTPTPPVDAVAPADSAPPAPAVASPGSVAAPAQASPNAAAPPDADKHAN